MQAVGPAEVRVVGLARDRVAAGRVDAVDGSSSEQLAGSSTSSISALTSRGLRHVGDVEDLRRAERRRVRARLAAVVRPLLQRAADGVLGVGDQERPAVVADRLRVLAGRAVEREARDQALVAVHLRRSRAAAPGRPATRLVSTSSTGLAGVRRLAVVAGPAVVAGRRRVVGPTRPSAWAWPGR